MGKSIRNQTLGRKRRYGYGLTDARQLTARTENWIASSEWSGVSREHQGETGDHHWHLGRRPSCAWRHQQLVSNYASASML